MSERTPSAYISAPGYNAPQRVASEKLNQVIEDAGYKPVLPMVSEEIPEVSEAENCLASLREADLVVAWLDGLTAEGVSVYAVGGIETEAEIHFPQESMELMQAGAVTMAKMGKTKQKRGIVLPHELNSPPPVPAGMSVNYGRMGKALCVLLGQPMNFPDISTIVEVTYAFALGKPVIALAMVEPMIGMYLGWTCDVYVDTYAKLRTVLDGYKSTALNPSGGERRKKLTELQKAVGHDPHAQHRKQVAIRKKLAEEAEADILPPVKPEEEDGSD